MTDIHSCSYFCDRPECIKAQRDELRSRLAQPEQESFSPEAISSTQAAWKMGYDAAKAEQPERIQLTVRDFVITVGDIEDAVGTPMYWAEWPNREQP